MNKQLEELNIFVIKHNSLMEEIAKNPIGFAKIQSINEDNINLIGLPNGVEELIETYCDKLYDIVEGYNICADVKVKLVENDVIYKYRDYVCEKGFSEKEICTYRIVI